MRVQLLVVAQRGDVDILLPRHIEDGGPGSRLDQLGEGDLAIVDLGEELGSSGFRGFRQAIEEGGIELLGDDPEGNPDVKDVRDMSSRALQAALDMTVEWAFDRYSFGRPLASAPGGNATAASAAMTWKPGS